MADQTHELVLPRSQMDSTAEEVDLEDIAAHQGRCAYGLRRMAVDASRENGVSDEALKIQGGWKEIMTPNSIYADQQPAWAMNEAAEALEHIRRGTGGEDTRPQS